MRFLFYIGIFINVFLVTSCSEDSFEISQTGGVQLQYQLDLSLTRKDRVDKVAEQVKKIISGRLDSYGIKRKQVKFIENDNLLVEIPEVAAEERIKGIDKLISTTGKMTIRLVDKDKNKMSSVGRYPLSAKEEEISRIKKEWEDYRRSLTEWSRKFVESEKQEIGDPPREPESVICVEYEREKIVDGTGRTVFVYKIDPETKESVIKRMLILHNEPLNILDGKHVKSAHVSFDKRILQYSIKFKLNNKGAALFEDLTGNHIKEYIAIEVDGVIKSVSVIRSVISSQAQISGSFSPEEARHLAALLSAGSLPVKLKLVMEKVIKPQPGQSGS